MMNLPADCLYTPKDQWLRRDGDSTGDSQSDEWTLGITDYGQSELGELVLVELPAAGDAVRAGASFGVVESVKAVSELVSPCAGEVVAANAEVDQNPSIVNESPFENGWLVRIRVAGEMPPLMDAAQYTAFRNL